MALVKGYAKINQLYTLYYKGQTHKTKTISPTSVVKHRNLTGRKRANPPDIFFQVPKRSRPNLIPPPKQRFPTRYVLSNYNHSIREAKESEFEI